MKKETLDNNVVGISPLGGNSVDGGNVQDVPLVYDSRVNAYISEQAVEELDDREDSLEKARMYQEEEDFRAKIGYRHS